MKQSEAPKEALKEQVEDYCKKRAISRAEFARKAGVSTATLSAIDNGDFSKVSDKMARKITALIESESTEAKLFNTADFEAVVRLCETAQRYKLMIGLIGDTGTGKTTSLTAYSARPNVYRLTFEKSMNPRQFFSAMLRAMGIEFEGCVCAMIGRISEELNKREAPLLIIDEAGKMTQAVMLYLHDLREKTKKACGVVLAGMPYFKENLQKNAGRAKEGYSEFLRRVNIWHALGGLSASEAKYIALERGITDPDKAQAFSKLKRFGDLENEILLYQIMNGVI